MWKRVAPVYMASPTASICETYRHSEQKPARKFCRQKRKKQRTAPGPPPKRAKPGAFCFLGGGGLYQGAGEAQRRPVPATNHKTVAAALVLWARNPPFFLTVPGRLDTIRYGK